GSAKPTARQMPLSHKMPFLLTPSVLATAGSPATGQSAGKRCYIYSGSRWQIPPHRYKATSAFPIEGTAPLPHKMPSTTTHPASLADTAYSAVAAQKITHTWLLATGQKYCRPMLQSSS